MRIGRWSGCHQLAERSFFVNGYQFPVCARCTGVFVGYIICLSTFFLLLNLKIALAGCFIMFLDWFIQYKEWHESTNIRRFITGVLGGYGILSIQILCIRTIIHAILVR